MDDEGLEVLSLIWQRSGAIGLLPKQLRWIQMPMLGKSSGGSRLILFAGTYRIWQGARRWMVSCISPQPSRGFWGAAKGRSALGCASLQAARADSDRARQRNHLMWVIDLSTYYESISLETLRVKFLKFGCVQAR
eukprot:5846752-Pyramimonas_sp.AAC.1